MIKKIIFSILTVFVLSASPALAVAPKGMQIDYENGGNPPSPLFEDHDIKPCDIHSRWFTVTNNTDSPFPVGIKLVNLDNPYGLASQLQVTIFENTNPETFLFFGDMDDLEAEDVVDLSSALGAGENKTFTVKIHFVCSAPNKYQKSEIGFDFEIGTLVKENGNGNGNQNGGGNGHSSASSSTFGGTIMTFSDPQRGTISGFKYHDIRGTTTIDPEDELLPGWTIYIDINNNGLLDAGEPFSVTNSSGRYEFTGLLAGTYTIREVNREGWIRHTPGLDQDYKYIINLSAGQNATDYNFGNILGRISGVEAIAPQTETEEEEQGRVLGAEETPRTGIPYHAVYLIFSGCLGLSAVLPKKRLRI